MSSRRTKKLKLKKFILPLTFVVGLASFPLGQLAFNQSKKAAQSIGLIDKKPKKRAVAVRSGPKYQQVKSQKRSHKVARHKNKVNKKKIARTRSKPARERYAH
jgi:hypothetical protein